MPKLTPTFNDQAGDKPRRGRPPKLPNGNGLHIGNGHSPIHIEEAHEPLRDEPMGGVQFLQNSQATVFPFPTGPILQTSPVAEPQPLKVALVGTAPSSRLLAPFNDPSWKIWVCSPGNMNTAPRVDAWFELHGNLMWPENKHYGEPYIKWLNEQKFPIYMQDQTVVPHAMPFPMNEMVKEFGRNFFTSSFAWMMALAITQGAKEIALYGIDMASRDEYILQRPGFYFFKHEAERRGIKVSAPNESDIMQPPGLYGYSDVTPFGRKILAREKEIKDRLGGLKGQLGQLQQNVTYLEGALEDIDYVKSIWLGQG